MSRFNVTTLAAVLLLAIAVLATEGAARTGWIAGVLVVYVVLLGLGVTFINLQFFGPARCRGNPDGNGVALTFDDGPDPDATSRLLDLLKVQEVEAAFFCTGERAQAHPDIMRRIEEEGHLVGNHTHQHAWWTNLLIGPGLSAEIGRAQRAIQNAAGVRPVYFRSPMGLTNPHLHGVLKQEALELVGWDVRGFDRKRSPNMTIDRVGALARGGSIIALHDGGVPAEDVVAAAAGIIAALRERNFQIIRLDRLLETDEPAGVKERV